MGLFRHWLTGATALVLCFSLHAQTGERVALVIGNSSYPKVPLLNPRNDATGMGNLLRQAGFSVDQQLDTTKEQLSEAVARFGAAIKNPNVKFALFYYAGQGLQQDWRNYLVPVSADIQTAADVRNKTVDVSELLAYMDQAKGRSFLVILDACRDDPFAGAYRPPAKGLSQFDAPVGSLLAYSTAPGSVARDGEGENGLYTSYLLKEFAVRGARLEDAFKRVRLNVRIESQGLQVPWESTSLEDDVYLFPSERLKLTDAEQDELFEREMASWMRVRSSNDHQLLANFIREYPSGSVSELAQARLKRVLTAQARLKAQPVIVAAAAAPMIRDTQARSEEAARLADQEAQQARARAAELEAQRAAAAREEAQRLAAAQAEAARLAQLRAEAQKQAELEAQRLAAMRAAELEAQRIAAARAAQEAEKARVEAARADAERVAAAREQELRVAAAQAEATRLAQARAEAQKQAELEAQRAVAARALREAELARAEAETRRAQAMKVEAERVAAAQAEAARAEATRIESERLAAAREQEQRLAAAQAEAARLAQARAEAQKQAELQAQHAAARALREAELAKAEAEARRTQAAKVEADRLAAAAQAEAARRAADSEKVAAAEAAVDTLAATPYFKGYSEHQRQYRTGDQFNYQVIDAFTKAAKPLSLQVTAVDVDADKVEYNNGEYLSDTMGNTIANPRGGFNTPRQFYPAELFVGKKWRTAFKQSRPGGIVYTFRYDMKVVGKETITVPAGTFETFKIEARGFNMQLNARLERNIWVAPGVSGDIAHEIFVRLRNGVIEQNDRQELVSYRQAVQRAAAR